jgi:hypothetical protein
MEMGMKELEWYLITILCLDNNNNNNNKELKWIFNFQYLVFIIKNNYKMISQIVHDGVVIILS